MKNFLCKLHGHTFVSIKKENILVKEFECKHCHKKFTTDGYGRIVKLTTFWKENNEQIDLIIQNRTAS